MAEKDTEIFKGDNTGAFGNTFITINLENPLEYPISKAVFVCGCIQKEFINPVFPLQINFNSTETSKLNLSANVCYLVVFDEFGKQKTCQGTLTFNAKQGVLNKNGRFCC